MVRAVGEARSNGMTVQKACEVLQLPRVTFYHWRGGRNPDELTVADLTPVMTERRVSPQRITEVEREAIVEAAQDEAKVDLHHRKLAHTLGREERVYVSESTVLRVSQRRGVGGTSGGSPSASSPAAGTGGNRAAAGLVLGFLVR